MTEKDTGEFTSAETDFDASSRRMRSKTARQLANIDRRPNPPPPYIMGNDLLNSFIFLDRIRSPPLSSK